MSCVVPCRGVVCTEHSLTLHIGAKGVSCKQQQQQQAGQSGAERRRHTPRRAGEWFQVGLANAAAAER